MNVLQQVYNFIIRYFLSTPVPQEKESKGVQCYIDDDKVDCWIQELQRKGYEWDPNESWWSREWSTNNGTETILECYTKSGTDGKWKSIMIGYGGHVFYEEEFNPQEYETP